MSTPSNLSEQILALPGGAGSVQSAGQTFQADPYTGTGRYAIPIAVEPGPAGIAPSLALSYSTHGGHGVAGLGWSLGLARIERRTDKGLPTFDDDTDTFTLQGDELLHVGAEVYVPRIDTRFARVRRVRSAEANYWVVTERDGTRVFYGLSASARLHDGRIAAWFAEKKQDVHGNEVHYRYTRDPETRDVRLAEVTWAGCYRVLFTYERRPDPLTSARSGFVHTEDHRLAGIDVQVKKTSTGLLTTVRRYALFYQTSAWTGRSLLERVTVTGTDAAGSSRTLPSLVFGYVDPAESPPRWHEVRGGVPGDSLREPNLSLVRQSGSGLPDILETRGTGHKLRVNLGNGVFAAPRSVAAPACALADPGTFISDMDGDGFGDLVVNGGTRVYRGAPGGGWGESYRSAARPSVDLDDPTVRLADLTGNGLPDVLHASPSGWRYYPNEGTGTWGAPVRLLAAPNLRLDDPRVHLVDVTGDGLADLVQVLPRRITVWPGLGRGRFGDPYDLRNVPDLSEVRPHQVRWSDLTGSGLADLVIVHHGTIEVYLNHQGTRLATARTFRAPHATASAHAEVVDLLGTGAAGVLFTDRASSTPNWRFLEVFPEGSPDLLTSIDNGLGARTTLSYTSSAAEWARDRAEGHPWKTAMPSAQRVVSAVTTEDQVTGNVLGVTYRYHHGVYDGEEREFRGFAMVEQIDREAPKDDPSPIAQARIVRWFHTGAELTLWDTFAAHPRGTTDSDPLPPVPWARRSLRGLPYREETWAVDGSRRPYTISETGYRAFLRERRGNGNRYAFAPLPVRTRTTHLEQGHDLDLRIVETTTRYDLHHGTGFGLPIEVREKGYGRAGSFSADHEAQQAAALERFTVTSYRNKAEWETIADDRGPYTPKYLVGKPYEISTYGVVGESEVLLARERRYYDGDDFVGTGSPGSGVPPSLTRGLLKRRLVRALTWNDVESIFPGSAAESLLVSAGGYTEAETDEYWIEAERYAHTASGLVSQALDPRGGTSTFSYDDTYDLFPVGFTDALGHPTTLTRGDLPHQVAKVTDANDNETEFTYDPSGLPKSKSVKGKYVGGSWQGDPTTHPTEEYDYDFDVTPVRVLVRTRQQRLGSTFDVYRYVDGLGRTIQERHTAEPDPSAPEVPRFRVTGWQVFNHKGLVVRSYQPTLAGTSAYGVGSTETASVSTTYDALGRPIRVDHPDGTFETTTYHPWAQETADRNDNTAHLTGADPRYGYAVTSLAIATHMDTPTKVFLDAWGRSIAVAEDNDTAVHITRTVYDLKDQVIEVWDARGLEDPTWRFTYDLAGRRLLASHLTAMGDRATLPDAAGNPIWSIDSRGVEVTRTFDALQRPLTETSDDGTPKLRRAWRYVAYDPEDADHDAHLARNLYGRLEEARDADGLRYFDYDHRGLVTAARHRFWDIAWTDGQADVWTQGSAWDPAVPATAREDVTSWLTLPGLDDTPTATLTTTYDAAGRPVLVTGPSFTTGGASRSLRTEATYNAAGLLDTVTADQGDGNGLVDVVTGCRYDARGTLVELTHGNGVVTSWEVDADIERLLRVFTRVPGATGTRFQDLAYTYDPVGNPLRIRDDLDGNAYKANQLIPNTRTFRYDPRYRLTGATGKKHDTVGLKTSNVHIPSPDPNDYVPYDLDYAYDPVGNFTTNEEYDTGTLHYKAGRIDLFNGDSTEAGSFTDPATGNFTYDANGNTLHTPRHQELAYTFDNQVRYVDLGGGGEVRTLRHADQRVLRLVKKSGVYALGLYLGPFELHQRVGTVAFTKAVLHVEGHGRHAQVERVLAGSDPDSLPIFYHHSDHLGSGHVLTKADGGLLSQEEYFPYGRASDRRDARNRYRYIGVERDEDTGLCMTGPRTYDPVSGRFLQGDPKISPNWTPYSYAHGSPTALLDRSGYDPQSANMRGTMRQIDALSDTGILPPQLRAIISSSSVVEDSGSTMGAVSVVAWWIMPAAEDRILSPNPHRINVDVSLGPNVDTVVHEAAHLGTIQLSGPGDYDDEWSRLVTGYVVGEGKELVGGNQVHPLLSRAQAAEVASEAVASYAQERMAPFVEAIQLVDEWTPAHNYGPEDVEAILESRLDGSSPVPNLDATTHSQGRTFDVSARAEQWADEHLGLDTLPADASDPRATALLDQLRNKQSAANQ